MSHIREFLSARKSKKHAVRFGTDKHLEMQRINMADKDNEIVKKISANPSLFVFFSNDSRAEVPIAGIMNGKFITRRIDRLVIDNENRQIKFLDYKTDTDKDTFREKYIYQMNEYAQLLKSAHPDYSVEGYILWLTDFTLERI